jgi:hypothetical protein
MAYNPDDPYGIGDLYNGNFDVDPSFFTSEPVRMREHAANNLAEPLGGTPYVPASSGDGNIGGGGGGGGGSAPAPSAPPPAPLLPSFVPITSSITSIKQAPIDTVVFNEDTVSIQQLTELLYEQIGGMELINIAREDTVSGQDVIYSPISNIGSIWGQFNPNNVIAVGSSFDTFFSRFAIDLILRGMNIPYFNEDGDLIIEIDDVLSDEEIHYQIASSGTINEVDI